MTDQRSLTRLIRRVDAKQQEFGPAAVAFGVVKKFGDDNAGTLVANLAYSGFVCVFPLLLVLVTILNIALAGDTALRRSLLHSALGEFPIIGPQLGSNIHTVQHSSVIALVIGILALVWGSTGLAQAGVFSMSQVWNLPGTERPNSSGAWVEACSFSWSSESAWWCRPFWPEWVRSATTTGAPVSSAKHWPSW